MISCVRTTITITFIKYFSSVNRGLYRGMDIHLLRSVPNAAIMFLSYELVNSWLEKHPYFLSSQKLQFPKLSDFVPKIRPTASKDSRVA